jgi:hypothetical protein
VWVVVVVLGTTGWVTVVRLTVVVVDVGGGVVYTVSWLVHASRANPATSKNKVVRIFVMS